MTHRAVAAHPGSGGPPAARVTACMRPVFFKGVRLRRPRRRLPAGPCGLRFPRQPGGLPKCSRYSWGHVAERSSPFQAEGPGSSHSCRASFRALHNCRVTSSPIWPNLKPHHTGFFRYRNTSVPVEQLRQVRNRGSSAILRRRIRLRSREAVELARRLRRFQTGLRHRIPHRAWRLVCAHRSLLQICLLIAAGPSGTGAR